LQRLLEFLHLFFAFSYVASLVIGEWNGRAARATDDWKQRAILYQIIWLSCRVAGFGSLFLSGVFGNLAAILLGYSMAHSPWFQWVNGLWLAALAGMILLTVPNASHLAKQSLVGAAGGTPQGFERALARWRIGNVVQSLLYLTLLAFMVWHWKS